MVSRYAAHGTRRYGLGPIPVYRRSIWEIQVVAGGAHPTFGIGEGAAGRRFVFPEALDGGRVNDGTRYCVWVFRPESVHGWTDEREGISEVGVVHVDSVPGELREAVGDAPWVCVETGSGGGTPELGRVIRDLIDKVAELGNPFTPGGATVHRLRTIAWVYTATAWIVEATGPQITLTERDVSLTERVLAWYEANMHQGCTIRDIARAVSTGESTIERAFKRRLGQSIGSVTLARRMERAAWLIRYSNEPFVAIAESCGYGDQSSFSRAVRRFYGVSPGTMRDQASS